jgi:hypothetical protein
VDSGPDIVAGLSQVDKQEDQKYQDHRVNDRQQDFLFRISDQDKPSFFLLRQERKERAVAKI